MRKRASGILLHVSSLPGKYGIGDLGPEAYKFVDFLASAKQSYWQVLPLTPPALRKYSYSPYDCLSAFAGSSFLISPELLYEEGLLAKKDFQKIPKFPDNKVDYKAVIPFKTRLVRRAFENFRINSKPVAFNRFYKNNKDWLEEYAIFSALRQKTGRLWCDWPAKLRDRDNETINLAKNELKDEIESIIFSQYIFFKQFQSLKRYCRKRNIKLIGDIPFYVSYDSVDVWANPEIFKLNKSKKPKYISGVPPDYFSRTGQLWGNPVYDWKVLKQKDFRWWIQRVEHNLKLFDIVRFDHFRGFVNYWQVSAGSKNAEKGKWIPGPKEGFFYLLFRKIPAMRFIAEDLGYITADVRKLIKKYDLTCMKVLMFGFDQNDSDNPHHPRNCISNSIVYTGTHDNNTTKGWFKNEATQTQKKNLLKYIGKKIPTSRIHLEFIKIAMDCDSDISVIPMQDVLGLDQQARMNHPGTIRGNWTWKLRPVDMQPSISEILAKFTQTYHRT